MKIYIKGKIDINFDGIRKFLIKNGFIPIIPKYIDHDKFYDSSGDRKRNLKKLIKCDYLFHYDNYDNIGCEDDVVYKVGIEKIYHFSHRKYPNIVLKKKELDKSVKKRAKKGSVYNANEFPESEIYICENGEKYYIYDNCEVVKLI